MRSTMLVGLALATLGACGGAPSPPAPTAAPPHAASPGPKKTEDPAASKAAAVEALTAGEAKSGTCDEGHKAALEKLLSEVENGMKAKNGEDGKPLGLQVVGKRVVALGTSAKSFEMAVSGRGTEVHVLAFGVKDVSLDVLVGSTAATTMRSPFQRAATSTPPMLELPEVGTITDVQSDSRQVQIKPGQPIVVKLTGQGCVGLVSFLKP